VFHFLGSGINIGAKLTRAHRMMQMRTRKRPFGVLHVMANDMIAHNPAIGRISIGGHYGCGWCSQHKVHRNLGLRRGIFFLEASYYFIGLNIVFNPPSEYVGRQGSDFAELARRRHGANVEATKRGDPLPCPHLQPQPWEQSAIRESVGGKYKGTAAEISALTKTGFMLDLTEAGVKVCRGACGGTASLACGCYLLGVGP
jgi:hypothetical protein